MESQHFKAQFNVVSEQVPTILKEILIKKAQHKIQHNTRVVPQIPPDLESIFIIAEIKRASPSAGDIGAITDPVSLAESYLQGGALAISILCEKDYFKGDLEDLKMVKCALPQACILRKDFITQIGQIKESYDFGADMVLLIASVFMGENGGFKQLRALYDEALKWNLMPLLEVHNVQEVEFITPLKAKLIGINSRNLHTFVIDKIKAYNLLHPIKARNPNAKVIFESSLHCDADGFVVGNLGFDGVLCGSYLVQSVHPKAALLGLKDSIQRGQTAPNAFYKNAFLLLESQFGFVKFCGITNVEDALMCAQALQELESKESQKVGALGFIFEPKSPRFVGAERLEQLLEALKAYPNVLKIVVLKDDTMQMQHALELYENGSIDALQLHGVESQYFGGVDLRKANFAYYAAVNVEGKEDKKKLENVLSPFVLLDSKSALGGGSGKVIAREVLKELGLQYLCVAGGVGIENISTLKQLGVKMFDINSSIEEKPGKKDRCKLESFLKKFMESHNAIP